MFVWYFSHRIGIIFNSTRSVGQGSGIRVILACRTLTIGMGWWWHPSDLPGDFPRVFSPAKVIVVGVFLHLGSRESPKGSEGEAKSLEILVFAKFRRLPKLSHAKLQVVWAEILVGFLQPLVNASFKISNAQSAEITRVHHTPTCQLLLTISNKKDDIAPILGATVGLKRGQHNSWLPTGWCLWHKISSA